MGVRARVVLHAADEPSAAVAATRAFERIEQLDAVMSDYRDDSELAWLERQRAGEWVRVSEDLHAVLERARYISEKTGGAFDVTVGPVVRLWRAARQSGEHPGDEQTREAMRAVGHRLVELDAETRAVRLGAAGMRLDLGGIGKGHAAHEALRTLAELGHADSLVDLGGDLALGSPPPGAQGWSIRVDDGRGGTSRVVLSETCVATSGDAEQTTLIGGVRYAHIIDPRTGQPLTEPRAATVIHPDGATADAMASAACVLGPGGVDRLCALFPDARITVRGPGAGLGP